MTTGKLAAVVISVSMLSGVFCTAGTRTLAAEKSQHTVTVKDFDGNVLDKITVDDGAKLDLSGVDTSSLEKHLDIYTQIGFSSWSSYPDKITSDITVYALYTKRAISLDAVPTKVRYYSDNGNVDLSGLKVSITSYTQRPEKDSSGKFKVDEERLNIESKCTVSPSDLKTAFADGNKASVKVYPIDSSKPIAVYDIYHYPNHGDSNLDGNVDASDASAILSFYSLASTGRTPEYKEGQKSRCDVDHNDNVDANDASLVLVYYSAASTGKSPSWDDMLAGK